MVGGGDYTGDDWNDVYAVDARTGALVRRSYDQNIFEMTGSATVGTGWGSSRLPVADSERDYDYYSDGANDFLARNASTGELIGYSGDAVGGIDGTSVRSDDFKNANLIETAGDFTGDGHNDALMRIASGSLYAGPGNGTYFDYGARIHIGTGWNAMKEIIAPGDLDHDGHADWIARRRSDGSLFLHRGNGTGGYSSRPEIGAYGWNAMNIIA